MTLDSGDDLFVRVEDRGLKIVAVSPDAGRREATYTPEEAMLWLEDLVNKSRNYYVPLWTGGTNVTLTQFEARMLAKCVENQAHKLFFR